MIPGNDHGHFYEGLSNEGGPPIYHDFYQGTPPPQNQFQQMPHGDWQGNLPPQFYNVTGSRGLNPQKMFPGMESQRMPGGFQGMPSGMSMHMGNNPGFQMFRPNEPNGPPMHMPLNAFVPNSQMLPQPIGIKKEPKPLSTKKQPKGSQAQGLPPHSGSHPGRNYPYSQSSIPSAECTPTNKMDTGFQSSKNDAGSFSGMEHAPGINLEFIDDEDKSNDELFEKPENPKNLYLNLGQSGAGNQVMRGPSQMIMNHPIAAGQMPQMGQMGQFRPNAPPQELQNFERVELIIPNLNDSNNFKHCGFCRKCNAFSTSL